jgi:hypothetical protein
MEFVSRDKCIAHYHEQFPNLPRYMVEMALDYDLANGGLSHEKPKTGAQKRKAKRVKQLQGLGTRRQNSEVKQLIEKSKSQTVAVEIDCAKVIPQGEYKPAPMMAGFIEVDGAEVVKSKLVESYEVIENDQDLNVID